MKIIEQFLHLQFTSDPHHCPNVKGTSTVGLKRKGLHLAEVHPVTFKTTKSQKLKIKTSKICLNSLANTPEKHM